jgi:hypothetical protein
LANLGIQPHHLAVGFFTPRLQPKKVVGVIDRLYSAGFTLLGVVGGQRMQGLQG